MVATDVGRLAGLPAQVDTLLLLLLLILLLLLASNYLGRVGGMVARSLHCPGRGAGNASHPTSGGGGGTEDSGRTCLKDTFGGKNI